MREAHEKVLQKVRAEAAATGVTLLSCEGMAPFVITGVVEGRFFYLRERHDVYRVAMAPDDDPLADIWKNYDRADITVATGVSDDFLDEQGTFAALAAFRLAVNAVRVALRRRNCVHQTAEGTWFCPDCGVQLTTQ